MIILSDIVKSLKSVLEEHGDIEFCVETKCSDQLDKHDMTAYGSFSRGIEIRDDHGGKDGKYCVLIVSDNE